MPDLENKDKILFRCHEHDFLGLTAATESFVQLKNWLFEIFSQLNAPERDCRQVVISAEEIFSNIVKYGYSPSSEEKPVKIYAEYAKDTRDFHLTFVDRGIAFDPQTRSTGLPRARIQDHIPGGLGLFLVQQFMDNLTYRRENSCNILKISKTISVCE